MRRGPKSLYRHLLRSMRAGDVLYLPETAKRMDRQIVAAIGRGGGQAMTSCFVAVNLDPDTAHRVVRIEMVRAMTS